MNTNMLIEDQKDFRVRNLEREYQQLEEMKDGGRYRHVEMNIEKVQFLLSECIGLHQHVHRLETMLNQFATSALSFPQPLMIPKEKIG